MSQTGPGNLWPSTEINLPAAAQSECGHQKRVLFEWPHLAHWGGQQQEVDVTIDRLWVISGQPRASIRLNVRSTRRSLPILLEPKWVCESGLFPLGVCVYCTGLVSHSRAGFFFKAHQVLFKLGITQTVGSLRHLKSALCDTGTHIIYTHRDTSHKQTCANTHTHTTAKKAKHAQDRLRSHNRALLF